MNDEEMRAKLAKLDAKGTSPEEQTAIMREIAAEHGPVDIEQIDMFTMVADAAVNMALDEILEMARRMNSEMVPTSVLEFIAEHTKRDGCTYGKLVYATVQHLGFEVAMSVPDDLSELEGM